MGMDAATITTGTTGTTEKPPMTEVAAPAQLVDLRRGRGEGAKINGHLFKQVPHPDVWRHYECVNCGRGVLSRGEGNDFSCVRTVI